MKTIMNRAFALALLYIASVSTIVYSQGEPTYKNLSYGPYERNIMDVWLASSEKPTPVVIFVHGGGFTAGDKSKISKMNIEQFLKSGISVAAINYRYRTNEPDGVFASLNDSKRALQFIRYKAREWNIDKEKVGMYGGSAGAGTSLWLAFHDEMSDAGNADPVLRESTRIKAAGAVSPQCTYDLLQWPKLLGFDAQNEFERTGDKDVLEFLGLKDMKELESEKGKRIRAEADILSLISPDDPPFFVSCNMPGDIPPKTRGQLVHHPMHAKILLEKGIEKSVNVSAFIPAYNYNDNIDVVSFFKEKLK
ncbi:MAG: alpha/beta hydrolase [Bacteroidia bacterium]|nr:alpha/beta hydrolase [Bacteroidia bacterium]